MENDLQHETVPVELGEKKSRMFTFFSDALQKGTFDEKKLEKLSALEFHILRGMVEEHYLNVLRSASVKVKIAELKNIILRIFNDEARWSNPDFLAQKTVEALCNQIRAENMRRRMPIPL